MLIIRRSKLYYTASGIITPIGGRPISIVKPTRCTNVSNYFILEWHSTCFGRSFRPSPGVQDCTYSNRHLSNRYCWQLVSKQSAVLTEPSGPMGCPVPGALICCTCFASLSSFRCNYVVISSVDGSCGQRPSCLRPLLFFSLLFPWPVWPSWRGPTEHFFISARTRSWRTCVDITTVYVTGGGRRRIPITVMDGLP